MNKTVYITGHISPDLDSVAGAIAYAHLKKSLDPNTTYVASSAGELNAETKYVLDKFSVPYPEQLSSIAGKKLILVDHNEREQILDGIDEAEIVEIIDHHKMNFSYSQPIRIVIEPLGASCTVIAKMFKADNIEIPTALAGVMLGAVLVDTVIGNSPTTTTDDMQIIEELAQIAKIEDWEVFGKEIFKVRSSVSELSDEEIITADFKDLDIEGNKIGIGQVETATPEDFEKREVGLLKALEDKKVSQVYHSVILLISDIFTKESTFLIASEEPDKIAGAFGATQENNKFKASVISRKKEVVPALHQALK